MKLRAALAFRHTLSVLLLTSAAGASALPISDRPLFLTGDTPPMVMLNLSKDHQLSYKAYNDYTDLDGDGTPDTTYKHSFNYYGYFDPLKCYTYNTSHQRFVPVAVSTDNKYCNAGGASGQWSGNFLNWVSMTRMDIVRKILYGGMRSTDTSSLTVLERAYLPTDAHSYAKYYNGPDIARLTPFSSIPTTPATSTSTSSVSFTAGDKTVVTSVNYEVGDQIRLEDVSNSSRWMIGGVSAKSGTTMTLKVESTGIAPGATGSASNWRVINLSSTGITFCNTTIGRGDSNSANRLSHTNTNPPLIRVARGNFTLWGANEKQQCLWAEERSNLQSGFAGGFRSNGNRAALSGILASAENPLREVHGLGTGTARGAYIARVEVCNSLLLGNETCKRYPAGNYKPTGLLQEYGDDGQILFGLMTGSFQKNVSGGVLRQPVSDFGSGVNHRSTDAVRDGSFKTDATGRPTNGIVRNLNALRIYGYSYQNNDSYGSTDGCTYQRTAIRVSGASDPEVNQGNCSSWGNPMAEIYLESLRYLASSTTTQPTAAFTYSQSNSKDAALGLTVATWTPPLNDDNYCSPLSVLNFNASVSSYDADQVSGLAPIQSTSSASQLTDAVGGYENINGGSWFVGRVGSTGDNLCSAKTLSSFGEALGLCPEAPTLEGSYLMSGLAHFARTNRIKQLPTGVSGTDFPNALKVETYGVALATNVPRIELNANGNRVTILPAYRLDRSSNGSGPFGGGTLVDFKIVEQTPTYGKFYVNWEDSAFGGDYDQDMWGIIEYRVSGNSVKVTTKAVSASTANGQGFGYIISGTNNDGPHFHSGIYNFDYTDPRNVTVIREDTNTVANGSTGFINASGGCRNCTVDNPPTSVTYTITGNAAGSLKDPLWYAAKYGGFRDTNDNNVPDLQSEWDGDGDGNPDNFVFANDPVRLVEGLARAFEQIGRRRSSAAAIAANSTQLNTDTAIFQARFDSTRWSGSLRALQLLPNGRVGNQLWDAAQQLPAADQRNILTHNGTTGVSFAWSNLSSAQQGHLNTGPGNVVDTRGQDRLNFLRGDRSLERSRSTTGIFRDRDQVLGDIINSDPFFVQQQYFGYERLPGSEGSSYYAFVTANANRTPMVYVGANDGMLHAFNAENGPNGGREVFAYVPRAVYPKLWELTDPDYNDRHIFFVDGSPYVGEAYINGAWGSYLVSGLGAGGRSIFAINVTNPTAVTASSVMWEFTDSELCYTFSQPQIARLPNGTWAAIFGNGYPKTSGSYQCTTSGAFLYVVDLASGNQIARLGIDAGSTAYNGANNGLSTPALVDTDGDRIIDTVYAGDLYGNVWKFDLSNSNPSNWRVANRSGSRDRPLFSARNASDQRQPITAPLEVGRHPNGGFMVYFGTGRYVAEGDPTDLTVQSFYGIWDRPDTGPSNEITYTTATRSSILQQQTLLSETTVAGREVRTVSANNVNWSTQRGWFLDLIQPTTPPTAQGERVVDPPLLRFGRVIFNTLIPSTSSCSFGGTSWLMELSAVTGQRINETVLDVNGDGVFNADDYSGGNPVSGMRSSVGITSTPRVISAGALEFKLQSGSDTTGTNEGIQVTTEKGGDRPPRGSWRQLISR